MERNKATKEQQNRELVGNSLELIGNQAICTCTNGSVPAQLNVVSQQKVFCNGGTRLIATNADKDVRSLNFGNCKAKNNAPCTACVKWSKVYDKIIVTNAFLPLTMKSEALCTSGGGKISFLTSGQQVLVIPPTSLKDANSIAYASPLLEESDMKREVKEERKAVDTPQKEYSKTAFVNGVRVNGVKTLSLRVNSQEELVFTNTLTENADPSTPIKWEVVYEGKNGENKTTILEAPPSRELFREEGIYKVYAYVKNRGNRLGGGYVLITVSSPKFTGIEWRDSNGRIAKHTSWKHIVYAHLKFEGVKDIAISAKIYYFGTERKEYITASPLPLQIDEGGNAKVELSLKYNQVAKMKEDRKPLKAKCKFYIELESNEWIENDKAIKDTPIEYTDEEEISSMFLYEDQECTKRVKGFIECGNTFYAKVSTRNLDNDTLTLFIFRHTVVEEENEEIKGTVYRQEKEIGKDGVVVFRIDTSEAWLIPDTSNSFDVFVLEGSFKDEIVVSPQGCWLEPNTSKYFRSGKDKGLIILSPKKEAIKEGQSITVVQEVKDKQGQCPRCREEWSDMLPRLRQVFSKISATRLEVVAKAYTRHMRKLGMDSCWVKAHIFAQAAIETGYTLTISEDMRYSRERLENIFPSSIFKGKWVLKPKRHWVSERDKNGQRIYKPGIKENLDSIYRVQNLKERDKLIANFVYAHKNGNGDYKSEDGWRFRGCGLVQLTGRINYQRVQNIMKNRLELETDIMTYGADTLEKDAELATIASMCYIYFYSRSKVKELCDGKRSTSEFSQKVGHDVDKGKNSNWSKKQHSFDTETSLAFKVDECTYISQKEKKEEHKAEVGWHDPLDNPQITIYTQKGNYNPCNQLFGVARPKGKRHQGIDFFAREGTPLYACLSGKVVTVRKKEDKDNPAKHNYVVIEISDEEQLKIFRLRRRTNYFVDKKNGECSEGPGFNASSNRIYFIYYHMSKITVIKGQSVNAGDIIGLSGITGVRDGTCGPHLHFEIKSANTFGDRLNNRVNPALYVYYKKENDLSKDEKAIQLDRKKNGQLKDS